MDKVIKDINANNDRQRQEQQRLEGQHEVMIYHMGKASYAPIDLSKSGLRILDSGCANGRWLRDLKASSPAQHEYIGIDIDESLYPPQPPDDMHFQNQSIKEDFPSEWQHNFDFVHQRFVMPAAAPGTIHQVVEKLAALLKPDGWMQLIEMNTDPNPENGPMFEQLLAMMREMFDMIGVGASFAKNMAEAMSKAGLKGIQSKEIYVAHALPSSFANEQLDGFEDRLRKELEERGAHSKMIIVWGQREV